MAGHTQDLTRRARTMRAASSGLLALALLAASGCSGGSDDASKKPATTSTTSTTPAGPAEPLPATSECKDEAGDVKAAAPSELDDTAAKAGDLVATTFARKDDVVEVTWTFAEGTAAATEDGGNQLMAAELRPADDRYPAAEVSIIRAAGLDPAVYLTTWDGEGEPENANDPKDVPAKLSGDSITLSVPVERLAPLFPAEWEWSATAGSSHVDGKTQFAGEDTCGSKESGGGSVPVTFTGVDLS